LFERFINTSKYSIQDRRSAYVFAIDPEGSTDFDDAFSITTNDEGHTVVSIYIANVAVWLEHLCFWNELTTRVSTIYMPDKRRLLLPAVLTDQIFTLKQKQDNITMYLDVTIDSNGMVAADKTTFGNACINVKKNFVYEEDRLLKNEHYKKLLDITHRLDNTIEESHSLVSYWMIHTNTYFAGLLKEKNIGMFRASSLTTDLYVIPKDNITNEEYNMLKNFKTIHCDYVNACEDLSHIAMGLDMYTHITSPIRRVVDIYNQLCVQYYYGFIDELSNDAISFLEHYSSLTGYINQQTKRIKKVQNSCNIIHMVMTNPSILSSEYEVILFDCQHHKLGYAYNVYLPSLKIFSKVKTDKIYENYSKTRCQLYYFSSENQVNNKVKVQLL
jgi:exoribonuclease R